MKRSKNFQNYREKIDRLKKYPLEEAVKILKENHFAKFDETVEIAVRLGVNPKHADQMVRGAIVLPHGTGRSVRVLVFAKGDKEKEAQDAGADYVGAEDLAKKIQDEGWLEFDRVIASPDMMGMTVSSSFMLKPKPISLRMFLISVSDLRPKLRYLSISLSLFWTRSRMVLMPAASRQL